VTNVIYLPTILPIGEQVQPQTNQFSYVCIQQGNEQAMIMLSLKKRCSVRHISHCNP